MGILKNSRHEKFALARFKGMSQKDAAIEAGYKNGATTGIDVTAFRLLKNAKIIERIRELHEEAKSPVVMTFKRRQERLTEIGEADLTDFVVSGDPKLDKKTPNRRAAAELYKRNSFNKQGDPVVTKSIKLHNPMAAIDLLNKMDGAYPPAQVEVETGEELTEFLKGLRGYGKKD